MICSILELLFITIKDNTCRNGYHYSSWVSEIRKVSTEVKFLLDSEYLDMNCVNYMYHRSPCDLPDSTSEARHEGF